MSNSWLSLDPIFPLWCAAVLTATLFTFIIFREARRALRFKTLRICAQLVSWLSILGLLLRPSYHDRVPSQEIVILTYGYDRLKADSIARQRPTARILLAEGCEPYPSAERLSTFMDLVGMGDHIKWVIGEGLPPHALDLLDHKHFQYLPARQPEGITQLSIPSPVYSNRRAEVRGYVRTGKTRLQLVGPGGIEDSVTLTVGGPFTLSFKPAQTGLFVYSVIVKEGSKPPRTEKVPIEILPERKLRILFLLQFPSAEMRHLKNSLAEKGHAIAIRSRISRSNFKYEYANLDPMPLDFISNDLVSGFDLVLLDGSGLDHSSPQESQILETGVKGGLGLILLIPEVPRKGQWINQFLSVTTKPQETDTVRVSFPGSRVYTLPAVALTVPAAPPVHPVTKSRGRILSGYVFAGSGRIGFQFLRETYRIRLEGNPEDHAILWSSLIEQTARPKRDLYKVTIKNDFPVYPDEPLSIEIVSTGPQPALQADGLLLPLAEDAIVDDLWQGRSWSGKPGWHKLSFKDSSTELNYFVSDKEAWKSLRLTNQSDENARHGFERAAVERAPAYRQTRVAARWFYMLFLIASGFLWLAPKI